MAWREDAHITKLKVDQLTIAGTVTNGLHISGACTTAINVSTAQTDETNLANAAVFQHGSYDTEIAYGDQTNHLILKSMHISVAATAAKWVFGDVNYIETSDDSIGYIDVGYNYLSVGHDLVNGFGSRGRVAVTAACELGEMCGVLGTMEIGAHAITANGAATLSAGIFDTDIAVGATVAQEVTCLEIRPHVRANIAGSSSGIRININCSSTNYVDFGLDIRSMSAQQTAAIRILATPASAALACGIHIEGQGSSTSTVTNAINLVGTITNVLDFDETDGSQAACTVGTYNSGYNETPIACFKVDMNGTAGYVYIHDTVIGVA